MGIGYSPKIVTDGLVLCLDAANPKSYPGTGTTWYDLMGNYNFTLSSASAYKNDSQGKYMDLENYGCKYLPGGTLTDVAHYSSATICIFSEVKTNDGDWKTLVRSASGDHQVIVYSGDGISLGMYDNDVGGFQDTSFNLTSLPNYNTQFNFMVWKLSSSSPYYQFYYNNNTDVASATLASSSTQAYQRGFASIGGYHNANSTPTSFSQEFGKISSFMYYSKHLSSKEIQQNFQAMRGRYAL